MSQAQHKQNLDRAVRSIAEHVTVETDVEDEVDRVMKRLTSLDVETFTDGLKALRCRLDAVSIDLTHTTVLEVETHLLRGYLIQDVKAVVAARMVAAS